MPKHLPLAKMRTETVYHCARCGEDHHDLIFAQFRGEPIVDEDGTVWNWWSLCRITGDPVLLREVPAGVQIVKTELDSEIYESIKQEWRIPRG